MRVFLKEVKIKGIKNLNDFAHIQFTKKDIKNIDELKTSNIKSIYGPNGSGKTAIVHAFNILKSLLLKSNYLVDDAEVNRLRELVNKKQNAIEIQIDFFTYEQSKGIRINSYEIKVFYDKNQFNIIYEKYSVKESEYAKPKIIFEVIQGKPEVYTLETDQSEFANLLHKRTFINVFLLDTGSDESDMKSNDFDHVFALFKLAFSLHIRLDSKDEHENFFKLNEIENIPKTFINEFSLSHKNYHNLSNDQKLVSKELLARLKELNIKKTNFIKIFKPNIKNIIIKERLVKKEGKTSYYAINEFIDYGEYQIDTEFESMGIKKLLDLYMLLNRLIKGDIVIIDELDSHINDVYLIKLIEYVSEYLDGQLIFTTHNVSPMETLRSKKYAIDFMTQKGEIVSWTQIGNYSPSRLYRGGMIKNLPFNLTSDDFLSVLGDGK